MANLTLKDTCPCLSGKPYANCCEPILNGKSKPVTAEDLLRARYSAFVVGNIDFILSSHHSKTRGEVNREEITNWSKDSKWEGLVILQKEAGEATDSTGTIVFHAKYVFDGELQNHYEKATFEKENGDWKFLDAQGLQNGPYVRAEPKLGRNDPCHCGNGKKFKKCHGTAA
ncbi:MAG: SEC-C domain-containing protein [Cryobacterium sp.]|nr:SEC-C domain-containing protein [Oligoflexia bacterium]